MRAGKAVEAARTEHESVRADQLLRVLRIIRHATATGDLRGFPARLVRTLHDDDPSLSHVSLFSWDPCKGLLEVLASSGEAALPPGPRRPDGVLAIALETGTARKAADPRTRVEGPVPVAPASRSALCVPAPSNGRILALLNLESREPDRFSEADVVFFEILCELVSSTLPAIGLDEEVRRRSDQIRWMTGTFARIIAAPSLSEAFDLAVHALVDEHGYDSALVAFVSGDATHLAVQAQHRRPEADPPQGSRLEILRGITGQVAAGKRTFCCNDTSAEDGRMAFVAGVKAELCVPLMAGATLVGVLDVTAREANAFDHEEVRLIETLGGLLALATEKATSLEKARRTRDELEDLIARSGDGILALDTESRLTRWNRGMERILGYGHLEVLGWSTADLRAAGILAHASAAVERAMVGETLESIPERCRRRDGGEVDAMLSMSPIMGPSGAIDGVSIIVKDVTESRRLEQIVSSAQREKGALQLQLQHSERLSALGQLISGVAHELNNPLTGVLGYSQLLVGTECDERVRRGLEKVYTEARRCHRVVQNLLAFARKRTPEKRYISVNDILENTLELRAYQFRVDDVQVKADLSRDLPRTMGDFHQLQQVFLNVINNAFQAIRSTGRGGILTVRSSVLRDRIRVEIADTGPGIPAENLSRVFDPFFTTKGQGEGTGLGLSICSGIVEEHDGKILVSSTPGEGTLFTIDLPIHGPVELPAGEARREGLAEGS